MVQLVLAHAIQCCEEQDGLDIYQVLAVRYYERESRMIRARTPLKRIGSNCECVVISPFSWTFFMCAVVAAAQAGGTSIVIWKLVYPVLETLDSGDYAALQDICIMEEWRWEKVYSCVFIIQINIEFTGDNRKDASPRE